MRISPTRSGSRRKIYLGGVTAPMERSARTLRPEGPYSAVAQVYDQIYSWKDYGLEAHRLREIVRRSDGRRARTLLDVACGTGAHLRYLSRWFEATGLDLNASMLAVAHRRLPGVRLVRAPMQGFRLNQKFDVITCLFSAIGYVRSEADLRRTLRTFARHLHDGGVVIVEPWITPQNWRPGKVRLVAHRTRAGAVVRMDRATTRGGRSRLEMHYLVGTKGQVRHWSEVHTMGLFSRATMEGAFRAAGLRVRYLNRGFMPGRGLYVARKIPSPVRPQPPRRRSRAG
jgi:ubiquinone/menaquinone biosynthesis C-methylase UbiE